MIGKYLKNRDLRAVAILLALNVVVYLNIFSSFLYADDFPQYWGQRFGSVPEMFGKAMAASLAYLFRPVHYLFLSVYSQLFYISIPLCYFVIFLAHFLAAVSVYYFFLRIKKDGLFALFGAMLFITFMGSFEVVGWTVAVYYPLVIIFMLNSINAFNRGRGGLSFLLYLLALLTHEVAIFMLPLLVAYEVIIKGKTLKVETLKTYIAPFIVTVAYLTFYLTRRHYLPVAGMETQYVIGWHFIKNWLYYISTAFVPVVTEYRKGAVLGTSLIFIIKMLKVGVLLVLPFAITYSVRNRIKVLNFFFLWVILTVTPFVFFITSPVSRYLYVASIGVVAIYSFLGISLLENKRFKVVGVILLCGLILSNLGGMIVAQRILWHKKELRKNILTSVLDMRGQIKEGDKIIFIDLPILETEIRGMIYLYKKSDKYDIRAINHDNASGKESDRRTIEGAKRNADHVFKYDFSMRKLIYLK
ncbi:hypothetical protein ACFLZ2_03405 [Candidatus Margulisiibacteriota bacterium]